MKLLIIANLLLFFNMPTEEGQLTKTFHQTIDTDEVEEICAYYEDENVEIVTWEGNMIMVEVSVVIHNTSEALFNYFEKSGRYNTLTSLDGGSLILKAAEKKQQSVMVKGAKKESYEEITVRIMVPSEFKEVEKNKWKRAESM